MRAGFGVEIIRLERGDAEQRGVGNLQRAWKQSAAGGRLGAIGCVAQHRSGRGARGGQRERRGEVAAIHVDVNRLDDAYDGAGAVGRSRRGRGEVT